MHLIGTGRGRERRRHRGEVMDLDAYTGGFNLQIAFATAMAAAEAAVYAD